MNCYQHLYCRTRMHKQNSDKISTHTHTHTHPFNGPFSGSTQVSWYQKGKTNLDSTLASDSKWQWHQLGHMQVCTLLHTDNQASTPPLSFLQAGCPSCRPTNSVKALKVYGYYIVHENIIWDKFSKQKSTGDWHTFIQKTVNELTN